eukprot:7295787-Ditylum_brightwellii.AAC.1
MDKKLHQQHCIADAKEKKLSDISRCVLGCFCHGNMTSQTNQNLAVMELASLNVRASMAPSPSK